MEWISNIINKAEANRWLAHAVFSFAFLFDICWLGNPFSYSNAVPYGVVSLGGEASVMLLKLAQLKYGVVNAGVDNNELEDTSDHRSISSWGLHGGGSDVSALPTKGSGAGSADTGSNTESGNEKS